jgi:hypothetical protein
MPRKKQAKFVYSEDMVGLWLYLLEDGAYFLISDRPIVDPTTRERITRVCDNHRTQLLAWLDERVELNADFG